jgi:hypothetical protein
LFHQSAPVGRRRRQFLEKSEIKCIRFVACFLFVTVLDYEEID